MPVNKHGEVDLRESWAYIAWKIGVGSAQVWRHVERTWFPDRNRATQTIDFDNYSINASSTVTLPRRVK